MSEVSESLQIKTQDQEGCIARFQRAGFNGFVFRGDRRWLTVVPYGGAEGLAPYIGAWIGASARSLNAPVLAYVCVEDFGWHFSLALPDGRATSFQAGSQEVWDTMAEYGASRPQFDERVLAQVVSVERVRTLLKAELRPGQPASEPAHAFARAIGFPQFLYLSPAYVSANPEDAVRRGGEEIGHRPTAVPDARRSVR